MIPFSNLTQAYTERIGTLNKSSEAKDDLTNRFFLMTQEREKSLGNPEELKVEYPDDFHFLQLVVKMREKIKFLKKEYHEIGLVNKNMEEKITNIKSIMENMIKQDEECQKMICLFRIEKDSAEVKDPERDTYIDKKLSQLQEIRIEKELQYKTNEKKMCDIIQKIQEIKKILSIPPEELTIETLPLSDETKALCVICSSRSIRFCLSGCGHCFCEECNKSMKDSCHVCRTHMSPRVKLFYD